MIASRFHRIALIPILGLALAAQLALAPANQARADVVQAGSSEPAAPPVSAVTDATLAPFYAAGSYYYVCVQASGTTTTLTYGQQTTSCHGSYLQQWLESGQHVQNISLTTTGDIPHLSANIDFNCKVAIVGNVVVVLTKTNKVMGAIGTAFSVGQTLAACTTH